MAFSPDGRWLAYHSTQSGRGEIYVTSFPGPQLLFEVASLPGETEHKSFTVAPDGRFLLNRVVERTSAPLTIVTDWRAGLAK